MSVGRKMPMCWFCMDVKWFPAFSFSHLLWFKKVGLSQKVVLQLTIWEEEDKRLRATLDKMQEFCRSFDFIWDKLGWEDQFWKCWHHPTRGNPLSLPSTAQNTSAFHPQILTRAWMKSAFLVVELVVEDETEIKVEDEDEDEDEIVSVQRGALPLL